MSILILLHTVVFLHYTQLTNWNDWSGYGVRWGGVKAVKILKTNYYKSLLSVILYKHVAYHQFTIACIQYVVLIHLSEQGRLIELES